jgi:acetylglutamate kinase
VIAGGTAGVLDAEGRTIERLTAREAARLVKAGTANKGMVAKLQACRNALKQGVGDVLVANGRRLEFQTLADSRAMQPDCTQVVR